MTHCSGFSTALHPDTKQHKAIIPCRLRSIDVHFHRSQAHGKIFFFFLRYFCLYLIGHSSQGARLTFSVTVASKGNCVRYMMVVPSPINIVFVTHSKVKERGLVMLGTNLCKHSTDWSHKHHPQGKLWYNQINMMATNMWWVNMQNLLWFLKVIQEGAVREE